MPIVSAEVAVELETKLTNNEPVIIVKSANTTLLADPNDNVNGMAVTKLDVDSEEPPTDATNGTTDDDRNDVATDCADLLDAKRISVCNAGVLVDSDPTLDTSGMALVNALVAMLLEFLLDASRIVLVSPDVADDIDPTELTNGTTDEVNNEVADDSEFRVDAKVILLVRFADDIELAAVVVTNLIAVARAAPVMLTAEAVDAITIIAVICAVCTELVPLMTAPKRIELVRLAVVTDVTETTDDDIEMPLTIADVADDTELTVDTKWAPVSVKFARTTLAELFAVACTLES